jgi:hypothetical protein
MKKTFTTFSLAALLLGGVAVFAQEQALAEADASNAAGKEKPGTKKPNGKKTSKKTSTRMTAKKN